MAETAVPKIESDALEGLLDLTRAHFVGIGGLGMLPVARVCAERGYTVSGSDVKEPAGLAALGELGAQLFTDHRAGNLPSDATALVFANAVRADNPEIARAKELGIPVVHRSLALNSLMSGHTSIAVMGTHGKSSTSAMLAFALDRLGRSPSHVVGADLDGPGSGGRAGSGGFFVAEVDESDRSHIGMQMSVAVITNIAYDHPETYAEEMDHVDAYEECVRTGLAAGGTLVLNTDSAGCRELASRLAMAGDGPRVVTFGTSSSADWRLTNMADEEGHTTATLTGPNGLELDLGLRVLGIHQLLNAAAAVAALHALGQEVDRAAEQLVDFQEARRRMTPAGEAAGVRIYDSFAHHPDEVTADLAAAHTLVRDGGRVVVVFQPTDDTRLSVFGDAFGRALAGCAEAVVTDSSRGIPVEALELLSARIVQASGISVDVVVERDKAMVYAAHAARPGDVIVLMGVGDVAEAGPVLLAALPELEPVAA
ncbi:UDP-N-acetylmuramate--alanine ligase [Streptomyces sp. Ag109_O5-1]|uniref:UDP-N-acetylmuramate--L-alanine ligase n=1 Tax=Streptomyces sp. Ag109_O5-1 TaxID=1938851 RepID=UPI000F51464A|nr:Mur ligase domain-containing protein [Streptomyces sp. Ag109_O5-1]RPE39076.1 UDP-N-acetylmuramate--alanine ligase [Streptomyces sp. Ag109_O5-1]